MPKYVMSVSGANYRPGGTFLCVSYDNETDMGIVLSDNYDGTTASAPAPYLRADGDIVYPALEAGERIVSATPWVRSSQPGNGPCYANMAAQVAGSYYDEAASLFMPAGAGVTVRAMPPTGRQSRHARHGARMETLQRRLLPAQLHRLRRPTFGPRICEAGVDF